MDPHLHLTVLTAEISWQHLTKVLHDVQCRAGVSKLFVVGLILIALTS